MDMYVVLAGVPYVIVEICIVFYLSWNVPVSIEAECMQGMRHKETFGEIILVLFWREFHEKLDNTLTSQCEAVARLA